MLTNGLVLTHPPCPDPRSPRVEKGFHERTPRAAEDDIEDGEEKDDDDDDDDDSDDNDDNDDDDQHLAHLCGLPLLLPAFTFCFALSLLHHRCSVCHNFHPHHQHLQHYHHSEILFRAPPKHIQPPQQTLQISETP